MSLRRLQIKSGVLTFFTVILALTFVIAVLVHSHVVSETIDRSTHDMVVESLQDQVDLLKWIGTAIVGSLCAVIAILWRTTQRQQKVIVEEVKAESGVRLEILQSASDTRDVIDRLSSAVGSLEKKIAAVAQDYESGRSRRG